MQKWFLPTLSEVLAQSEQNWAEDAVFPIKKAAGTESDRQPSDSDSKNDVSPALKRLTAERQWSGAIASLEVLLRSCVPAQHSTPSDRNSPVLRGIVLAGPLPVLSELVLNAHFQTWVFTTSYDKTLAWMPFQLPPAKETQTPQAPDYANSLPLLPGDLLASEQFCLVLTESFSLIMVLGENLTGSPTFLFSFEPEIVQQAWTLLRFRMLLTGAHHVSQLDALFQKFAPIAPDYRTVMQFSRLLLKYTPEPEEQGNRGAGEPRNRKVETQRNAEVIAHPKSSSVAARSAIQNLKSDDIELLQAFAHEVRTPLTTIRTLTRLLLKRKNLDPDVIKRLEIIDRECTEQIDRMELLFRAAELENSETQPHSVQLTTTSLAQVLQHSLPRWQNAAQRRNLTLDVLLPQNMPPVVCDPMMLDRVLTGLIENFTRSLPAGSHIQVRAIPAGNQLKVQLVPQMDDVEQDADEYSARSPLACAQSTWKSIGQLLMFQPETGSLTLNLNVTKNLFEALGGKLIVRQRPQQGEVLTIFLPLQAAGNQSDS